MRLFELIDDFLNERLAMIAKWTEPSVLATYHFEH